MKTTILILVGGLLVLSGCRNQTEKTVNDANQTSNIIETKAGKTFTIILPANRTTGYSWQIGKFTPGIVKLNDEEYKPAENPRGLVGAGGEQIWTFEAISAGKVTIHFEYARPWEKNIPAIKKNDYTIIVMK
jgi:inhibitor of cysteine peptidase